MNAAEYIDAGYCFDADGWTVTLDDTDCPTSPVAVHEAGYVMELEWDDPDDGHWSTDWSMSPLDPHFGDGDWRDPASLIAELKALYAAGRLRVRHAIHGVPGSSRLGALLM
jgi:hypothetical protein